MPVPHNQANIELFVSTIAPKDQPWLTYCTVDELFYFLQDPQGWVTDLRNNANANGNTFTLSQTFTIEAQVFTGAIPSDIALQGINGTGVVMIRVPLGAFEKMFGLYVEFQRLALAQPLAGDPAIRERDLVLTVDAFWRSFLTGDLDIMIDETGNRAYLHFPLVSPGQPASVRLSKIATFLFGAITQPATYLTLLQGIHQNAQHFMRGVAGPVPGRPSTAVIGAFPATMTFLYASDSTSTAEACDMLAGAYNLATNTITIETSIIKDYA